MPALLVSVKTPWNMMMMRYRTRSPIPASEYPMTPPARKAVLNASRHAVASPGPDPHAHRVVRAFEYTAI